MTNLTKLAAALAVFAAPAVAQQLPGASVSGNFVQLDDDNATKFNAGGELNVGGRFAVGGNLGTYNGSRLDDGSINVTARGMYRLSATSAFGLFVARDTLDGNEADSYGLEYGFKSANGAFDLYYGVFDNDSDVDESIAGISFEFAVARRFFLGFDYDVLTAESGGDGVGIGSGAFTGRYQLDNGASIFAEFGSVAVAATDGTTTVSATEDEFVGIGFSYDFGRNGGALFSNRSVADTIGY